MRLQGANRIFIFWTDQGCSAVALLLGSESRGERQLESLPDLLSAERADAVQPKGEDHPVFVAQADVESEVLRGDRTAFPRITCGGGRADQGTVASKWMLLKIEEERHAAIQSF